MDETALNPQQNSTEGHRERMRSRFLDRESAALEAPALLELLLSYAIPRRDVRPLADQLFARFGSLQRVLAAEPATLRAVTGVKDTTIALLKLAEQLRQLTPLVTEENSPSSTDVESLPADPEGTAPTPVDEEPALAAKIPAATRRVVSERKLQVSNGYLLDAQQLARLLEFIGGKPSARKISGAELIEGSGLSTRQVGNLVSIGSALGLIVPRTQLLTDFGRFVAKHDLFLDAVHTLEFCHFCAASRPRNLVWFEVFNDFLTTEPAMGQAGWSAWLRGRLASEYSDRSLVGHIAKEVRFILDAYTTRNFKKLGLLVETPEKTFCLRRHSALQPLSLAAIIYVLGERDGTRLLPFSDLHGLPGSPGRLFALDLGTLRQAVEALHQREWLRFEVRHGLDQVRLIEGFTSLEFLAAGYENRPPQLQVAPAASVPAQLLL